MAILLHLCLCVVTVIRLTSSQSTYDVIQQNDVSSCGRSEQVLSQLVTSVSQLVTDISQIKTAISQLHSDVAELKAFNQQTAVTGISEFGWQSRTMDTHSVKNSVHKCRVCIRKLFFASLTDRIGYLNGFRVK